MVYFTSSFAASLSLRDYGVGPHDVLKIEIWNNPDLSQEVTVSLGNKISFPLIGEMNVKGLTTEQVQHKIQARLADGYLVNPQVTVTVKEYNSQKVYVLGEVNKPGYYSLSRAATMVDVIAAAGGLAQDAGQEMYVLRSGEKGNIPPELLSTALKNDSGGGAGLPSQVITVSLDDFNQGVNLDFQLRDNDTLYIPKAKFFYVTGEVKYPGRFRLEKEMKILQAISMAQGLTDRANKKRIKVIRTIRGRNQEIKAKMTDPVLADDIIDVPESFF